MEKKTKNIIMIAVILILSVMFVLGNVAGGNSAPPTKSTTTTVTPTLLVTGNANAIVEGYSRNLVVYSDNASNSLIGALNALEKDGNINSYTNIGGQIGINGSNYTSYQVYNAISGYMDGSGINATVYVKLPNPLTLDYSGNPVRIDIGNATYSLQTSKIVGIGANVPVSVQAIVTEQGTLYQNQLRLVAK